MNEQIKVQIKTCFLEQNVGGWNSFGIVMSTLARKMDGGSLMLPSWAKNQTLNTAHIGAAHIALRVEGGCAGF